MHWLQTLDVNLFHWVNPALSNSFFDILMPFVSGNPLFGPALVVTCGLLICKGGTRGRLCVLMLILAIGLGDTLICKTLKELIHRPRPFWTLADVHLPPGVGRTDSGSMPSSHAANWAAATMVLFIYYRKSLWFMLPMALTVGFSRIYNGVHYPSDVLVGLILGAGYAACGVWTLDALWQWAGHRWFPLWWQQLPSLINPPSAALVAQPSRANPKSVDQQLMRLAYAWIFILLGINLAYIASGKISLSEDESYQWIWSKHLALSYYSKPLLIALFQRLGTSLWGDNAFGVRFCAPVISAVIAVALLRFMARVANVRVAFWLTLIVPAVPLLAVGSILMTIDPPSVMFWTLAMLAGWRAIQDSSTTRDWFWVGLWMGLGLLSKYTALYQLASWVMLFAVWPPARKQLRRPGPYVALLVNLLCIIPVAIWNQQHHWITIQHVSEGGHFDQPWAFTLANLWDGFTRFTLSFFAIETGLINPFFFLPAIWASIALWRRKPRNPLLVYFFSMGAPIFLFHLVFTLHSRVLPNWIAPAIVPLLCLGAVYWEERWREGFRPVKSWLASGLIVGTIAVVLMHDTNLLTKASGYTIPPQFNPTRRVRGWKETAQTVEAARRKLMEEGKPVFIIGGHFGITGELTFHTPEARAGVPDHPLVYFMSSKTPLNQFYFWPGYKDEPARKGQNALFVEELDLTGDRVNPTPTVLLDEFESVTNLGAVMVKLDGGPIRRLQIIECRGLR
ncbi:MAG: Phosphoesterase PA-phosphatase related protein [Pedosphaera sp.]|nr:Phosphoesterase PA-phosphatase related protein [Pedosphaera sp.]